MARLIGDAYIVIYPQTDLFGPKAAEGIDKQLKALKPTVDVRPVLDKSSMAKIVAELRAQADKLDVEADLAPGSAAKIRSELDAASKDVKVGATLNAAQMARVRQSFNSFLNDGVVSIDTRKAVADLDTLIEDTEALQERLSDLHSDVDDTAAEAKLARLEVQAAALSKALEKAGENSDADLAPLNARLLAIAAAFEKLNAEKINIDTAQVNNAVAALAARTAQLRTLLFSMRANVDDTEVEAKLAALQAQATKLSRSLTIAPGDADLAPFEAQLLGIQAAYEKIKTAQDAEDEELNKQKTLWDKLGVSGPGALVSIHELLNASIPPAKLFGGAVGDMYKAMSGNELPSFADHLVNVATSAHLTTEAVIEFAAIWVPATVAMAVFAAAATPTLKAIGTQLNNMNTAARGTGQSFKSLATNEESVTAAVKPSVMEAFGIALFAVQNHSSTLDSAMKTLGSDIDQMAAKAAVAFDSKVGGKFFQQGAQDANALMTSFEDLGSILGTLMKAVPGYAEVLLGFGNDILGLAADATKAVEPFLAEFLKLHGALLYGGLFGTAASWVFPKIVDAASSAALGVGLAAEKILGSESGIVKGATGLGAALQGLSAGPVVAGVGLLAGAIAAVVIYLKAAKTDADSFNTSIQKSIQSSSLGALQQTLQSAIQQTTVQYVKAQQQQAVATNYAATAQKNLAAEGRGAEATLLNNAAAVQQAQRNTAQYATGLNQLTTQQTNVNANLAELAKTYGTTIPGALSLANGAQVTSNQLTQQSASNTATLNAQVGGYLAQLKVMTAGTGTLNQALNVLNVTQSTQIQDAQKLASAYSTWIGIVTGGDSAFATFQQGITTLGDTLGQKLIPPTVTSTTVSNSARQSIEKLGGTSATTSKSVDKLGGTSTRTTTSIDQLASGARNVTTSLSKTNDAGQNVTSTLSKTAKGGQNVTSALTQTTSTSVKAATAADTLSVSLGKITEKFPLTGASMNGLSQASLAARQAFDQQIQAGTTLYGNLQTLATASGNTAASQVALARGGKDIVAELLPFAAGSKEATSEVYALAQIVGYTGPNSFASLAKWVGNVTKAEGDLNTQQGILTDSAANLTQAAKNLSSALSQEITQSEASAIAQTEKFSQTTLNLAKAMDQSQGAASNAVITYASQFYTALVKAGDGTSDARQQVDAFLQQLGATPAAVMEVNTVLGTNVKATLQNQQAVKSLNDASQANLNTLRSIPGALATTTSGYDQLFKAITSEDQALVNGTSQSGVAKNAFISFAENGLDLTTAAAKKLWDTQAAQNLTAMASKASTTKTAFEDYAKNGLGLTKTQADQLWTTLRLQYLDTLASKGDSAKNSFIQLAENGLDLSNSAAQTLWNTLTKQYLDTLASKADETRGAFEKTASQFDLTRGAADKLYDSMHSLASGSPYSANVNATISASGEVKAIESSGAAANIVNAALGDLQFSAAGGTVHGSTVPGSSSSVTHDNHLVMAKSGELIIPSQHAPKFRDMARKASIPGFASGGLVSAAPGVAANIGQIVSTANTATAKFTGQTVAAFVKNIEAGALPLDVAGTSASVAAALAAALQVTNTPASWLPALELMVSKESGGNASAVDPISVMGEHATGLLQTLPSTFAMYALPGYTNIDNAEDNAIAAIRYIKAAYGSPAAITGIGKPGTYQGYSAGGMVSEPVFGFGAYSGLPYSFAERGSEYVGPLSGNGAPGSGGIPGMSTYQARRLISLMEQQNKLLAQMPYSQAQAINQANGNGVRRGWFATSG